MAHLQMDVPEDVSALITSAVGSGEFASDSEVVTAALRLWSSERAVQEIGIDFIGRKWDEAIAANGPYHEPDPILDKLEQKYRSMADSEG